MRIRLASMAAVAAVAMGAGVSVTGPPEADARKRPCQISKSKVLLRSSLLVAYRTGERIEGSRSRTLAVCRLRDGRRQVLARGFWFGSPARGVAVSGGTYAFAEVSGVQEMDFPPLFIKVGSVTRPSRRRTLDPVSDPQFGQPKIGSLGVTPGGAAAWIECPETDPTNTQASPYPNCVRAGSSADTVVVAPVGEAPRKVAGGADIDPVSLRISAKGVVRWTQAGQRRTFALTK